jgi:putative glutamine amidotransferase
MRPLIGITTGEIINALHPWSPVTYGQSHTYSDVIIRAGGIPVLIPITNQKNALKEIYNRLDGLLLAGGNDLNPALYNEAVRFAVDISDARDNAETSLASWAIHDKKPILAICRGMHLLNVLGGGTLYQDIKAENPHAGNHEQSSHEQNIEFLAHRLRIGDHSRLAEIIGTSSAGANSHHHQSIKKLATSLSAVAWSKLKRNNLWLAFSVTPSPYMTQRPCGTNYFRRSCMLAVANIAGAYTMRRIC